MYVEFFITLVEFIKIYRFSEIPFFAMALGLNSDRHCSRVINLSTIQWEALITLMYSWGTNATYPGFLMSRSTCGLKISTFRIS